MDNLLAASGGVAVSGPQFYSQMPQDLDVLKMELRHKQAEFAVDHGLCIIILVASGESLRFGLSCCTNFRWFLGNWAQKVWEGSRESKSKLTG